MRLRLHSASSIALCFVAACLSEEGDDGSTSTTSTPLSIENGQNLNGQNLNGQNLNGSSALGTFIKFVRYNGAELDGKRLANVRLSGSQIVARRGHHSITGEEIEGAIFRGRSDTGHSLKLRIAAAFAPGANEDPTTWRYFVEYQETDHSWVPICVSGTTPIPAIPVDGYWDLHEGSPGDGGKITWGKKFLFACEQIGAIGKCVEAGYRPWQKVNGRSLDKYHQSCVRLLRADFCGTSESHTVDGFSVNIYDRLGVQTDTESWMPEAEWDHDGARCISMSATTPDLDNIPCMDELLEDDCAMGFGDHRTRMISERP